MEFELVNKHTDEIIDKKNLSDEIGIGGARTYFIGIKELNPNEFDKLFKVNPYVKTIERFAHLKEVFHVYHINVKKRDQLQQYLIKNGVDAKVHYPIPIHLQPAAKYLKYKRGDFPIAEKMANTTMSLPVHEFIKEKDIKYVANLINNFY